MLFELLNDLKQLLEACMKEPSKENQKRLDKMYKKLQKQLDMDPATAKILASKI